CTIHFSDVPQNAYFYEPVRYLCCEGVVSGYDDGTYRPWNPNTRGQIAKIISLAERWPLVDPAQATFEDVGVGTSFFRYVETAYSHGIISGYACGGIGEPCDPQHRPYFRPNASVTRGQTVKMVVLAQGWPLLDPATATYSDVARGSTFYRYVETATSRGIINGYACGGTGEPCDPQH